LTSSRQYVRVEFYHLLYSTVKNNKYFIYLKIIEDSIKDSIKGTPLRFSDMTGHEIFFEIDAI
jgi:hypothetical protein